jgi:hypothetical protein
MDRPRLIRGLRIAWGAVFGILCVLLIVLWVRSYWWWDTLHHVESGSERTTLGSNFGTLYLMHSMKPASDTRRWTLIRDEALRTPTKLRWRYVSGMVVIVVPDWIPVIIAGTIAAVPWIRPAKCFSLRTLLIATTLIAVVLGLVVYATR